MSAPSTGQYRLHIVRDQIGMLARVGVDPVRKRVQVTAKLGCLRGVPFATGLRKTHGSEKAV